MENINNLIVTGVESAAQMSIGQAILRLVDRILWVIEKSVQWSLPAQELIAEENGKSFGKVELVRPLPWIFFLPGLLILRMVRFGINLTAGVLGFPQVEPSDMVRVIQRGRRRIRVIKSSGLKNMRLKKTPPVKDRAMTMKEASKSLAKSIRLTLSTLSCLDSSNKTSPSPPPTKIRVSNILDPVPAVLEEKSDSLFTSPVQTDSKRKFSEISTDDMSEDETDEEPLISKIDRLANESASDKSFTMSDCTNEVSGSSESEEDVSITMSEVQDLQTEREELEKTWCGNPECAYAQCDNELHVKHSIKSPQRASENLLAAEKQMSAVTAARANKPQLQQQHMLTPIGDRATEEATTNGVSTAEMDTAYYSPISWKSVSPEVSIFSDKQDNQIDAEGKPEELSNGEVNNEKKSVDYDSNKPCVEVGGEVANGHMKEKQRTSSHSGGSNKHHQKNKRGNHGNRKKK